MTLSVFSSGAPAQALAGDDSTAEATFLSGNLVSGLLAVDLGEVSADNDGTETLQTVTSGVEALAGFDGSIAGISLPISLDAALLSTFAQAADDASSRAAAGLVSVDGDIAAGTAYTPGSFTLNLTEALVGDLLAELANLQLDVGAVSASAAVEAPADPAGDYSIVGTTLVLESATLGGISATVDGLASALSASVNEVTGSTGSLVQAVTNTINALPLAGAASVSANATLDLDLSAALSTVLAGELTEGPVTVDLSTGTLSIDLAQLNGGDLSGLAPNTGVLTSDQLLIVTSSLATLIGDLADALESAADSALGAAVLGIDVDVSVLGLPVGDVTVAGTLSEIAMGNAVVNFGIAGISVPVSTVAALVGTLSSTVSGLLDPATGGLLAFVNGLDSQVVAPVVSGLNPLLMTLDKVVSLTVNNQDITGVSPNQKFLETALRIEVLPPVGGGGLLTEIATLNVAQAAVGPNFAGVRPAIADVDPTSGPVSGGTLVTLTGTDFGGSTGVTFDGIAGTEFTIVNDEQITVISPAHAAGPVDVIIQHPAGASDAGEFIYTPVPIIESLTPDYGPIGGGTVVIIEGTDFTDATGVTFGGKPGTGFNVDSANQITVTTPAHDLGVVDVIIEREAGNSAPVDFTYRGAPSVESMTPVLGPIAGGTEVTITGTGFTGSTGVTFDGDLGASFRILSDTQIAVNSPAHDAGTVAVVVVHPLVDAAAVDFTYTTAPIISSMVPAVGPVAGGTVVTITGNGFTGSSGVTFDGIAGTAFEVESDSEITVTTPAHAAGAVNVLVVHPEGNSAPGSFTYLADPTVTEVSPNAGPLEGGTEVTITGTGFTGATGVTFDGDDGTSFTVVSDTEITVTTPPHAAGAAEIVILHPVADTAAGDFTYAATGIPLVNSMSPLVGPDTGGTLVTLRGSGFLGATGARFGALWGTDFTVLSDTMATVVTPAHDAMWVPAVLASGAITVSTPGFTFEPTTLAAGETADSDGLAFTGSTGFRAAWLALILIGVGALLINARRRLGHHRA